MTVGAKLVLLDSYLGNMSSTFNTMPIDVKNRINVSRSQVQTMSNAVPQALTSFYDNFGRNIQTVASTARNIGNLVDSPTQTLCGAVSLIAAGDFLNELEGKILSILDQAQDILLQYGIDPVGAIQRIHKELDAMVDSLSAAIGLTQILQEVDGIVDQAQAALLQVAQALGITQLPEVLAMASCLVHAASYTTNQATLLAAQVANLSLPPNNVRAAVVQATGIDNVMNTFTSGIKAKLGSINI